MCCIQWFVNDSLVQMILKFTFENLQNGNEYFINKFYMKSTEGDSEQFRKSENQFNSIKLHFRLENEREQFQ